MADRRAGRPGDSRSVGAEAVTRHRLILGVETSCDETAAAVVEAGTRVRSNVIASQDDLHVEFGGVVPEIASRAHAERILPVVERALAEAGVTLGDIDAIAVGNRPGLIGSLLVGVAAAKALAWALGVPIVGVDHVHAHLYAGTLEREQPEFPALGLVVSGGHTALYHLTSWSDITRLGSTIDDAVGEAFDKAASILGLPYPGGPRLDKLAQTGDPAVCAFPVSRLGPDSLDFSYSGLKTAVLYTVRGTPERVGDTTRFPRDHTSLSDQRRADIAASFQRAAIDAILLKLRRALASPIPLGEGPGERDSASASPPGRVGRGVKASATSSRPPCRTLLVGGGVSANSLLRAELPALAAEFDLNLRLPAMRHCLDNAAMIAGMADARLAAGARDDITLQAVPTTTH